MLLANRVAVITGAARGIGRATALKFASEGCSVVIADLLEEQAKQTAADCEKKGVKALAFKCDVTDAKQVKAVIAATMEKFGKIDILVNDAGAMFGGAPADKETEEH